MEIEVAERTKPVEISVHHAALPPASNAARWISFAAADAGTGSLHTESAKLRHALRPRSAIAATSYARAAISAEGKVPSQILDFLFGSRTSHTHFLEFFLLTPRYTGCLVSLNFFLPSRFLGFSEANITASYDKFTMQASSIYLSGIVLPWQKRSMPRSICDVCVWECASTLSSE
ncbi:hypothetical protein RGQ29_028745 [Quercus rubra]|uniref:Uncharacterized protein n=1 Tax=Quercus rubra TaxID=3512 RepID=A0AAN7ESP7_QUERU|nr:hypothetical protein RGQ29_028745 [Quercus rubra]